MPLKPEHRPAAVAALLAIALYAITLGGTYIYDDVYITKIDPRLDNVSRWDEYLTRGYFLNAPDNLWRPLTSLSFAVGQKLHGDHVWVPHLVNVLLYAAVCAAVAELARRVAGLRAAWFAGILFAVHPVHVEPVAGLVGRADLLSTLLILAAILLFLRGPVTLGRAAAIWGLTLAGVFTKELALLMPGLLLAWLPWRRAHRDRGEDRWPPLSPSERRANRTLLLLLCWSLAAYIAYRESTRAFRFSWDPAFLDAQIQPLVLSSGLDRWLVPFSLLGRYVQLLVFPWRLSIDYSGWTGPAHDWSDPYFYVGVATVLAWWVAVLIAWRRRAWSAVGLLLCLVISYSMISNFGILIGTNFGERLIFLPSVFFVLLIATAAARVQTKLLVPALAVVVLLATVRVETYAWRWLDALRLYTTCAAEQPTSARLPLLIMDELRDAGDYDGAARAGAAARAAKPEYWRAWWYSALVEAERGRPDDAQRLIAHGMTLPRTDPGAFGALRGKIARGEFATTRPATRPSTEPSVR